MTEKICRLCLQTITKNYETIGESLLKTLKLNLNITKENVTCTECANYLQVFSNFKTASAYRRNRILPLPDQENVDLDPVKIETINNLKSLIETERNCSFCAKTAGNVDFVSLSESKKYESLVNMLMQHIPEMNLNSTEELLTCEPCLEALQGVASFILKCLEVEETIIKYIELEGTDDRGQVELTNVKQIICRSTFKLENEYFDCNQIKVEYVTTAEAEIKYEKKPSDSELIIKTEDVDIKPETSDCDSGQQPSIENKIADDPLEIVKKNIEQQLLTHKSPSEKSTLKCTVCPYETKYKHHLNLHLLIHKHPSEINMFKCETCSYGAYHKGNLNRHLLTHKNSLELRMFECEVCSYNTKRKSDLKRHLLIHKSPSETNMIKCELCPYETNRKYNFKHHLLTHRSPSEIKMFKCEICPFETKRKHSLKIHHLKRHLLKHRSPTDVNMSKS